MTGRFDLLRLLIVRAVALVHRRVEVEHLELGLHIGHLANAHYDLAAALDHRIDCLVEGKGHRRPDGRLVPVFGSGFRARRFDPARCCRRWRGTDVDVFG